MAVPVAHLLRCARLLLDDMPGLPFFRYLAELIDVALLYWLVTRSHDIILPSRIRLVASRPDVEVAEYRQ